MLVCARLHTSAMVTDGAVGRYEGGYQDGEKHGTGTFTKSDGYR